MPNIEDAIALAVQAHRGQADREGAPYILHPLRVMARMETDLGRMIGVLHDVVEDTDTTLDDLRSAGYPPVVIEAIDALSRRPGEEYDDYIERVKPNHLARRIKLADLEDNMNLRRLPAVEEKDLKRLQRYRQAWGELISLEQ